MLPAGPKRQEHHAFPYIMLLAPLMMGGILFAVTQNVLSVVFMLMMPLFIVGHYVDQKLQAKRERKEQLKQFRESMAAFRTDITRLQNVERSVRLQEAPSVSDTVDSIYKLGPLLWTHRPEHTGFLGLRFGLGTAPSRIQFEEPNSNDTEAEYMAEIQECMAQFRDIEGVPVVSQLRSAGLLRPRRVPRPRRRRGPRHGAAARRPALARGSGPGRHHLGAVEGTLGMAAVAPARRLRPQPAQRRPPRRRPRGRLGPAVPAGRPDRPAGGRVADSAPGPAARRRPARHGPGGTAAAHRAGGRRGRRPGGPRPAHPGPRAGPRLRRARDVGGVLGAAASGRLPGLHGGRRRPRHHHRPGPARPAHLPGELRKPRRRPRRPAGPDAHAGRRRRQAAGGRLRPAARRLLRDPDRQGLPGQPGGRGRTLDRKQLGPGLRRAQPQGQRHPPGPGRAPRASNRSTSTSRTRARTPSSAAPPAPASPSSCSPG